MKKLNPDLFFLIPLALTLPLFFYRLGASSLTSWDEAWYAEIARNIVNTGELLKLNFNGLPYTDHPPAGFWLIAAAFKLFGVSEFTDRLVCAVLGFLGLIVVFYIGKNLFNRYVGFLSAVALSSSFWYLYRARSGNLDIILTFFFLLTFLLAIKTAENKKYLIPFSLSLAFLFLTKTMVPLTIIPALIVILWGKVRLKDLTFPLILFLSISAPWFIVGYLSYGDFVQHYLGIGLPGVSGQTDYLSNLKLMKEYVHNGIGKWFWPGALSVFLSVFFFQRRFFALSVFCLSFFAPFLMSAKGHIWHLIPLHPFMIITTFGFGYVFLEKIFSLKITPKLINKHKSLLATLALFAFCLYFYPVQIRQAWYLFLDISPFVSDEAILSRKASKYPGKLYIDGDFRPVAVFYSQKNNVDILYRGQLPYIFKETQPTLIITEEWHLKEANISEIDYEIIARDRDKLLIKPKEGN